MDTLFPLCACCDAGLRVFECPAMSPNLLPLSNIFFVDVAATGVRVPRA